MKHLNKIHHLSTLFAVWTSFLGAIGIAIIVFDEVFRINVFSDVLEKIIMFVSVIFALIFFLCLIVSIILSLYRLAIKE